MSIGGGRFEGVGSPTAVFSGVWGLPTDLGLVVGGVGNGSTRRVLVKIPHAEGVG